ncbi:MAG: T9SS type A sorting domain-containing protein [Bacteroidetes bacterium]|nr:T9SS type A sorting domain-containing protein [Bacteroidota bacterium]
MRSKIKFIKTGIKLIIFIFIQIRYIGLFGQYVENYRVSQHRGTVILSWTITTGNVCDGVEIERSSDSIHFSIIGSIPGVCGSPSEPRNYTYTDTAKNLRGKHYYRLNLRSLGLTESISIYIPSKSEGWVTLYPNPAHDAIWLRLNEESYRDSVTLAIYSIHSGESFKMRLYLANEIRITMHPKPGIYFYTVKSDLGISSSGMLIAY